MNTIKFYNAYDMRHETHNVGVIEEPKVLNINNKEYSVNSHASLMIYPTIKCNAKCNFCINKFDNTLISCKDLENDDLYLEKLSNTLDLLKDINPRVTICGGEPTKSHLLVPILELVKSKGFKFRTFATNGTGLLDTYNDKTIIQHLYDNGIKDNINISLISHSMSVNDIIMGKNGHLNHKQLKRIINFTNIHNMDMRLSVILHNGIIKTLEDILLMVDFCNNNNINSVMFREIVDFDRESKIKIRIDPILDEIEKSNKFERIDQLIGSYYCVDIYKYYNMIVKCYKEIKYKYITPSNDIRDFVFYSNGDLYASYEFDKDNVKLI